MRYVVADFETASRADLRKIGAWKYAQDMSTFILCLALKVVVDGRPNPNRVLSERQLQALDAELMELCLDESVIFIAHNAGFEQAMWKFHMVEMGYPELPPERWHDTMAAAGMRALPLGLDAVTTALELPIKKDMDGHRHMLLMCKPDRLGNWSHHNEFNLTRLYDYCGSDVDAQHGTYISTKGLGPSERATWIEDQKINQRGILIDKEFVHACMDVLEQVKVPMTERFRELTGGLRPTQREKVLNWVNEQGVPLGDMRKATLDAILDPDDEFGIEDFGEPLPYHVHEVLTLRRSLASSSVAKLQRMLDCAGVDGRVRYTMQYHGARTGRWAGRLIQVQNYPRGEISDRQGLTADILADAILTRNVDHVKELWGPDIFSAVISSLRSCIIPAPGNIIVAGDYAAVEARNLLAMAGQHDRVAQMHAGMDVYSEQASMIYKRPINRKKGDVKEGHIGKGCVLGAGYGLGAVGFRARFCPKESLDLAALAVNSYRYEFAPMVPKFWYGLWEASVSAVWCEHAKTYSFAGVEFRKEGDYLTMRLPSARKIYYHRPWKGTTYDPNGNERPSWTFMSYQGKKFRRMQAWHGMITADCIQGTSRDLIVGTIKRCAAENLPVIFSAHDEAVLEVPDNGKDYALILKQIMEDIEPWAIERRFKITAETDMMKRYRK